MDQPRDRLVQRDAGGNEDRKHDREPRKPVPVPAVMVMLVRMPVRARLNRL
jgi:hypothetical protein